MTTWGRLGAIAVAVLVALWTGYSFGYTDAMEEIAETWGAGARVVHVMRRDDGRLVWLTGDRDAAEDLDRAYRWRAEYGRAMERRSVP